MFDTLCRSWKFKAFVLYAAPYKHVRLRVLLLVFLLLLPLLLLLLLLPPALAAHCTTCAAAWVQVMFLDADAMPALDPAVLLDHPVYLATGSMFWQELW